MVFMYSIQLQCEACEEILDHKPECMIEDPSAKVGKVWTWLVTLQEDVM